MNSAYRCLNFSHILKNRSKSRQTWRYIFQPETSPPSATILQLSPSVSCLRHISVIKRFISLPNCQRQKKATTTQLFTRSAFEENDWPRFDTQSLLWPVDSRKHGQSSFWNWYQPYLCKHHWVLILKNVEWIKSIMSQNFLMESIKGLLLQPFYKINLVWFQ